MSTMPLTVVSNEAPSDNSPFQQAVASISRRISAARQRWVIRDSLSELRELDEFILRDIGASGDEIYRIHQLRNGQRPTLAVG